MKRRHLSSLVAVGFVALLFGASPAPAQVAPPLGKLHQFTVLGSRGWRAPPGRAAWSLETSVLVCYCLGHATFHPQPSSRGSSCATSRWGIGDRCCRLELMPSLPPTLAASQGPGHGAPSAHLTGHAHLRHLFFRGSGPLPAGGTLTLNGGGVFVFRMGSSLTHRRPRGSWFGGPLQRLLAGRQLRDPRRSRRFRTHHRGREHHRDRQRERSARRGNRATGAVTLAIGGNTIGGCATAAAAPAPVPTLPAIGAWALLMILLGIGAYALSRRTPTEASR